MHANVRVLQDDASLDLAAFRERFSDTPQKGDLTLLCPLKEDPTEKVCWSPSAPLMRDCRD